jgi:hypothetical protein
MHGWFLIQTFYHGLKRTSREHLDAAAGGAFFSLQVPAAKELIEKMVANQGWGGDRLQPRTRGVHQVDGIDKIAAKMDLLMKIWEASSNMETAKMMDSHMTCEVCGNVGHSCKGFLETRKEASFINNGNNNGFRKNYNNQGWNSRPNFSFNNQNGGKYCNSFNNHPSIEDLIFRQARINESLNKNLAANEKVLENLNSTIESFTSTMNNQLSFNKMIETQLAQLAASLPSSESAGIPGQPEPTRENLKSVTTRGGRTTRDPPHPNPAEKKQKEVTTKSDEEVDTEEASPGKERLRKTTPQEYVDTMLLPFPRRIKKPTADEQFGKFVEVIKKLNVIISFLKLCRYQPAPSTSKTSSKIRDLYPPRTWSSLRRSVVQPF